MRFNLSLAIAALLLGCLCPLRAQQPITAEQMPQQWHYATTFSQTLPSSDQWWREFNDPVLDSLIAMGVDNNYNVLMAQRRIEAARQALRQSQAGFYPQLSLSGGWNKARTSGMTGPQAGKAVTGSYFDLGVDMSWQIDVFGKVASRAKASRAQFNATRAEYDATMVTICAKIASAYFQLRTLQGEIALLDKHIASQEHITKITEARHEAALASGLDVAQARTTLYSTQASLVTMKQAETATINSLALLLGVFPEQIDAYLRQPGALPDYHQLVAVGVPMELLRRRPDLVEAESQLAAYAAQLGVAKKDFLPTIALNGSIGTSAHKVGDLFGKESLTYAIAPTLSWTIFDGFSRSAATEQARQQMLVGIDNYNMTLTNAVQEVETAMSSYQTDLQYIDCLDSAAEQARKALSLSVDLYKQGLTDFINVTDSQINLLQYTTQLVTAKGQALADLVSLYEALGGGFAR